MGEMLELARPLLASAFTAWGSPVTWLEIVAALALWMVERNMRVDPIAWPLAIASSIAYLLLFADSRLYGEASLQVVFIAVAGWGWWQWLRGRGADGAPLAVHRLDARSRWLVLALTLSGHILHIDRFGNLITDITTGDLPSGRYSIQVAGHQIDSLSRSYEQSRGLLALIGSSGHLEIASKGGSAARLLGSKPGDELRITRPAGRHRG